MGDNMLLVQSSKPPLLLLLLLVLLWPPSSNSCSFTPILNFGGLGAGGCPVSCLAVCQAANYASTTSCTYTHIWGIFFQVSSVITKACNLCYPVLAAAATATTTMTTTTVTTTSATG